VAVRFADVLERSKYSPAWCLVGSWAGNIGLMATSLASLMSTAIAASAGSPGSSGDSAAEALPEEEVVEADGGFKSHIKSQVGCRGTGLCLETRNLVLPQHPDHPPLHLYCCRRHDDRLHGNVRGPQPHPLAFLVNTLEGGFHAVH